MENRPLKAHIWLDTALAAAAALSCALMLRAACVFVLNDPETRGWVICAGGALLALALCPLAARLTDRLRGRALAAVAFLLAFAVRAAFVLEADSVPASDFGLQYFAAEALANGDAAALTGEYFSRWGYQIPFVLYESLIIALGGGVTALGLLNALWGALTAVCVFLLARRFAGAGSAFAAAALYALCPGAVLLTPVLTGQCISLFFLTLALLLCARGGWKWGALAGVSLAFGNLMRPEAILVLCGLLAALVLSLLERREGWRPLLLRFAALIAGYVLFTALFKAGIALSGAAPGGAGNAVPEWKFVLGLDTATLGRYDPKMEYILSIADPEARRAAAAEAIRASLGSCENLFGFFWDKTERFWGAYEESWLGVTSEYIYPLRFFERIFFTAASLLALIGCLGRRESRAETAARGVVFANFFVYLFIEVQPRYRYFVWPFLLMLAAAGIKRLCALVRGGRKTAPAASGHRRGERV